MGITFDALDRQAQDAVTWYIQEKLAGSVMSVDEEFPDFFERKANELAADTALVENKILPAYDKEVMKHAPDISEVLTKFVNMDRGSGKGRG